jgi:predicted ATPase
MRHTGNALDDPEKSLLQRRSVFSGGFDLQSVCAVVGSDGIESDGIDEYTILHLLDALLRKSLLIADRPSEQTRLSMLETIRQFASVRGARASGARPGLSHRAVGRSAPVPLPRARPGLVLRPRSCWFSDSGSLSG